jgi:FkbM family methyltransferase
VGANVGDIALRYNELFPNASICAFEPFPDSFELLKSNITGRVTIKPYQKAIAAVAGEQTFFVNYNADTNSLLPSQKMGLSSDKQVANKSEITVDVWTIDDFCKNENIEFIDILKLDIQGGELAALKGACNLLSKKKIGLIYTEAYFRQQYIDQPLFHDISKYLEQFGYFIQDIYSPIYGKGNLAWCDAIFLKA